jgi:hypothetical protein
LDDDNDILLFKWKSEEKLIPMKYRDLILQEANVDLNHEEQKEIQ